MKKTLAACVCVVTWVAAPAWAQQRPLVTEDPETFARLKAPVKRVCALQVPIPYSPALESHVFPDRKKIVAGVREVLGVRAR